MINVLSMILIGFGLFFFFVGTVGVLRFPDALTRAHGAAKCDTLGAVLSILGLILQAGFTVAALKLVLVILFLWTANPTATHVIAKAIYRNRHQEE
ncbi:monovalent cation/H(+) antiporter subunit G [Fusibacter paucivorans]|uniref:Monovalent cation/H(+) antiporter subunit G n=1 Tax=Fusibacter paucivorans TaxID=76009 RepID=A0ABS5PRI3_9FIRM|nr:monovalent cation/H(+) antiporter subunit G [Fusibacter paucivorans]MBS7527775.1 monovalent cation/H(+) antiporter subunit G [Fusibacter paucivorans]